MENSREEVITKKQKKKKQRKLKDSLEMIDEEVSQTYDTCRKQKKQGKKK